MPSCYRSFAWNDNFSYDLYYDEEIVEMLFERLSKEASASRAASGVRN